MSTNINEKNLAWADVREAARTNRILTAFAIGIETKTYEDINVDCLKVDFNGIYGYIPKQMLDNYDLKGMQMYMGTEVEFCVTHAIKDENSTTGLFMGSRVKALNVKAAAFRASAQVGDIYSAFISGVDDGRLYLVVDGVRTQISRREVSYAFIEDLREYFQIGDTIDVKITEYTKGDSQKEDKLVVDGRVHEIDPWENAVNYTVGSYYFGVIKRIHAEHGFFIELADSPGLIVRSNIPAYSGKLLYKVGDTIRVRIQEIDVEGRIIKAVAYTVNTHKKSDYALKKSYAK